MVALRKLYRYAACQDYILIFVGLLALLVSGANQPVQLIVFGRILDGFNGANRDEVKAHITFFALMYVGLGIQQMVTTAVQVTCFSAVAARQVRQIRQQYFAALLRRPTAYFDGQDSGALATSVLDSTASIASGIGEEFSMMIQRLLAFVIGLGVAFYSSWKFALVVTAGVPIIAILVKVANDAFAKRSGISETSLECASSLSTESISSIRTIAAFNYEEHVIGQYDEALLTARRGGIYFGKIKAALEGVTAPIIFILFGLGLWYGSKLVADDMETHSYCQWLSTDGKTQEPDPDRCHTGGKIMTSFLAILFGFLGSLQALPGFAALAVAKASAAKIFSVVDMAADAIDPMSTSTAPSVTVPALGCGAGCIRFVDVSFSYPARPDFRILRGLNVTVNAGQTVALVGPSGCGKSTMIALIERFYDPQSGSVLLDGTDLRELSVQWLRSQIGLVSQEPILFSGTIGQNVALGCAAATRDEVEMSIKMANAHEFITGFPDGYDTQVGEKGMKLSGGQKQRIAIARAVIRNPAVLLLDEATSALDTVSERIVQAALDELLKAKRRTTIVIAHRLSTIRDADKIVVLSEGIAVEEGPHEELVAKESGVYRALLQAQGNLSDGDKADVVKPDSADFGKNAQGNPTHDNEVCDNAKFDVASKSNNEQCSTLDAEAPQDRLNKWLWKIALSNKLCFLGGMVGAALNGLTMPAIGVLMAEFLVIFYNPDTEEMRADAFQWAMIFLGFGAISSISAILRNYCFAVVSESLAYQVRKRTFKAIIQQQVAWFDMSADRTAGALTSRLSMDCLTLKALTGERVSLALAQIVVLVSGLVIAFLASWQLTLVVFAIVPGIAIPVAIQAKFVAKFAEGASKALAQAGGHISDVILNIRTVASLGLEKRSIDTLYEDLVCPFKQDVRKGVASGFGGGIAAGVILVGAGFKYYIGGLFFDEGIVEFADIMRVVLVLIFMAFGMTSVSKGATDKAEAMQAARRLNEVLSDEAAISIRLNAGIVPTQPPAGQLEFVDVAFAYPSRPQIEIFKSFCLTISAGQTVALVGPSGSGKSTVVALVERFYDPMSGRILLDGTDLQDLSLRWLRSQIGLVSQEPVLFNGTIAKNIALGKEGSGQADIEHSSKIASAFDFINNFPDGFQTKVGDKGVQLSGGQKQRIAIARAIIRDPAVLILDEATSALDTASEHEVQAALDELLKARSYTTIIIAHRLSTIKGADKIAVVSDGVVAEEGPHQKLMNIEGGVYRALVTHAESRSSERKVS